MTNHRTRLKTLLRELFQFDAADLDFGIYRIMNQRRNEIDEFVEHGLLDAVAQEFKPLYKTASSERNVSSWPVWPDRCIQRWVTMPWTPMAISLQDNTQLPLALRYIQKQEEITHC